MRPSEPVSDAFAPPVSGWIVGPWFDAAFVVGPTLAAGLFAFGVPRDAELPGWAWVLFVLCIDVAHVWGTLYRTYLDVDELERRPLLYAGAPVVAAVGCIATALAAPESFWRILAYVALFHFVRQAVGIGVLYRARSGRPTRDRGGRIERLALYAVTVGPVVWWHAHLPRPFAWFVQGDFVAWLPAWVGAAAVAAAFAIVGLHVVERIRERRMALGSDLWLLGTGVAWVGGIVVAASDLGFTVSNVVAHGVPYLALVWWTAGRRWRIAGRGAVHPAAWTPLAAPLVLGALVALAFGEEALWDVLVWHDRPRLFGAWEPTSWATLAVGVLSVPQVTHYVLDGFVWKLGPTNPELRSLLGLGAAPAPVEVGT